MLPPLPHQTTISAQENRLKAITMLSQGHSIRQVASACNMSKTTAGRIRKTVTGRKKDVVKKSAKPKEDKRSMKKASARSQTPKSNNVTNIAARKESTFHNETTNAVQDQNNLHEEFCQVRLVPTTNDFRTILNVNRGFVYQQNANEECGEIKFDCLRHETEAFSETTAEAVEHAVVGLLSLAEPVNQNSKTNI